MLTYEDFNTLEEKNMCKLEGIGKLVAKRIVANRPYRSNKDLLKIKGLGKKTLENLGVILTTKPKKDKTQYFMDGELIDVSTLAYAINTHTKKVDFFWRIPKEFREYLG